MKVSNHTVLFIGIILIATSLRFYGLDRQSFWYDEIFEINYFINLFNRGYTMPDTPPLHPFIIYILRKFISNGDLALRTPPMIFGILSVLLIFFLGRNLFNEKTGLIASYLLAISPFHIWYSQEVRMYALQWMLALVSLIFFLRALQKPRYINYIGYILSTVLCLYTLQLTIFLLIIQFSYILLLFPNHHKNKLMTWFGLFAVIVMLYLPWIIYHFLYLANRGTSFLKETEFFMFIPYTFFSYFAGFSIGPSLSELHMNPSFDILKPYIYFITFLMAVYGSMFLLGIFSLRKETQKLALLILLAGVPIIGFLILINTLIPEMSYNVRYTGIALFGFIIIISKGIDSLTEEEWKIPGKFLATTILVLITVISSYSYWNYQFNPKYYKEDVRLAASYIRDNKKDGDVILVITSTCALSLNRYLDKSLQSVGYPPFNTNNREDVLSELKKIVKGKERLWLVLCREYVEKDLTSYTKQWLEQNFIEIKELYRDTSDIANLTIHCYKLTTRT